MSKHSTLFDRLLDPVGNCLTPEVAEKLVRLRADATTQSRIEELATRCNEGQLTPAEREEYAAYAATNQFIGLLQAKVRRLLHTRPAVP